MLGHFVKQVGRRNKWIERERYVEVYDVYEHSLDSNMFENDEDAPNHWLLVEGLRRREFSNEKCLDHLFRVPEFVEI